MNPPNTEHTGIKPNNQAGLAQDDAVCRSFNRYPWWLYPEASTYRGDVTIAKAQERIAELRLPADTAGKSVHVILAVTDTGRRH